MTEFHRYVDFHLTSLILALCLSPTPISYEAGVLWVGHFHSISPRRNLPVFLGSCLMVIWMYDGVGKLPHVSESKLLNQCLSWASGLTPVSPGTWHLPASGAPGDGEMQHSWLAWGCNFILFCQVSYRSSLLSTLHLLSTVVFPGAPFCMWVNNFYHYLIHLVRS